VPASQQQKVDYLLKKVGYSISKTGIAEDSSLSGTVKAPYAETIPSPLIIRGEIIWSQSDNIPVPTPPTVSTQYVKAYAPGVTSSFQMTYDSTISGNRTFVARQITGDTSSPNVGDWVDPQFSTNYTVNVYVGSPQGGGGTLISNDTWFFDYSSGVLNFNADTTPTQLGITTTNVFIVGWRYIGAKGVLSSGGQAQTDLSVASLNVSGITTLGVTSASQLFVSGISTFGNSTTGVKINGNAGIITSTSGVAITFFGNLSGTASTASFATTAFNLDITNALNTKVGFATTAFNVIGGIGSISQLSVSGVTTVGSGNTGIVIDGTTGIITSSKPGITTVTFVGNLSGTASTAGFAATAFKLEGFTPSTGSVGFATTAINVIGGIGSISQLSVSGFSTVGVLTATKIGIGTTNPTSELFVIGNSSVSGITTIGVGNTGIVIDGTTGIITSLKPGVGTVTYFGDGSKLTGIKGVTVESQVQITQSVFPTLASNSGVSSVGIATTGSTALAFIPSTGSLGIGTTNPTSKLTVNGNVLVSGITTVGSGNTGVVIDGTSGIITSISGFTTVTYFGDGSKLTGIKGVTVEFQAQSAQTLFPTFAANSGVSSIGIATTGSTALAFIPSTGSLGIGTTNPTSKLTVNGNVLISGITTIGVGNTGVVINAGIITSISGFTTVTFVGNLTGTASTASFATTSFTLNDRVESQFNVAFAQTSGISTNVIGGIGSITQLSVSGVTTSSEFVGGGSDLRNLKGTHLVSYASYSESSNSSMSISGISTYNKVGTLTAGIFAEINDLFGRSVATSADGKTIIVGATSDELTVFNNTGLVYVFDRNGNAYNRVGILTGSNSVDDADNFGCSVATSADGKTIIVGASADETTVTDTGLVYVFDRNGNSFNQVGILTGSNAGSNDLFGSSIATSADGKTIVVGASADETTGTDTGLVYVFDRNGNSFNQVGILTGSNAVDNNDNFGCSVATSADGKTIVVGASADELPGLSNTGLVYVFDRNGNSFNQVGILTGSNAGSGDLFGNSVATSADGKTIVVGASLDEISLPTADSGIAYVFDRNGNSFNQVGILTGTFAVDANDKYGNCVAISADGKKIIVGAIEDETIIGNFQSGLTYVYNRNGNSFNQVGILTGTNIPGNKFGSYVATSADGKTIVVGAELSTDENVTNGGAAFVFDEVKETYLQSNTQGNIGIGTSNPVSKLHVVGNAFITGVTTITGNLNAQSNIGIGTINPTSKLHVQGDARIVGATTITGNLNAPGNYYVKLAKTTNQTILTSGDTLIAFTATSDTNGWYSGITTRTTPTVAGTYNVSAMLNWQAGASSFVNQSNIQIRKNGSTFALSIVGVQTHPYTLNACGIVTMNGTTDYIDFTAYTSNPTSQVVAGTADGAWTKMEIFKIN
jgi:hypothetical protein